MRLKIKTLKLDAGRPIAFLNESTAKKLHLHIGERVQISNDGQKIIAIADIVKGFLKKDEVSLSQEIMGYLKVSPGDFVDVDFVLPPKSTQFIMNKLAGKTLSRNEIFMIIEDISSNLLTEAEIAYFVSGNYEHGMSMQETFYLTEAMYKTGVNLHWHTKDIVDKHCIGGIAGNRTTPIVVSICAAAGIVMPKTSSRAITSASGTADVMETITKVDFSSKDLQRIVKQTNACLAWGGSLGLAPSDDKLIRVERLLNLDPESQLIASILSKKLSVGSKYVLIDIPFGKNAKVNKKEALELKKKFLKVGKHFGLKMEIILTKGDEPIGNGIGPVLEMKDVLRVLRRDAPHPKDLEEKAILLAGIILEMTKKAGKGLGKMLAREILESGRAYKKFEEIISMQGKKDRELKPARYSYDIKAHSSGKIIAIDNKLTNLLGRVLGCPSDDSAGIYLYKHCKERVKKGEILLTFYAESPKKLREALDLYKKSKVIIIK
jgi:AMP phosphorylase